MYNEYKQLNLPQTIQLLEQHHVSKCYLFGSALTDKFNAESDIDLLLTFEGIELLDFADNYFDLQEKLEDTLHRKVDLVIEKDLKNPVLIQQIQKNRQLIYDRK